MDDFPITEAAVKEDILVGCKNYRERERERLSMREQWISGCRSTL